MDKSTLYNCLKSKFTKDELVFLSEKIGVNVNYRMKVDEIIDEIIKINGSDDMNLILDRADKNTLRGFNEYFDIVFSIKDTNEALISNIKKHLKKIDIKSLKQN
jgi:hypothetical protein